MESQCSELGGDLGQRRELTGMYPKVSEAESGGREVLLVSIPHQLQLPFDCALPGRLDRRVHIADAQIPLRILLISTYVFAHMSS